MRVPARPRAAAQSPGLVRNRRVDQQFQAERGDETADAGRDVAVVGSAYAVGDTGNPACGEPAGDSAVAPTADTAVTQADALNGDLAVARADVPSGDTIISKVVAGPFVPGTGKTSGCSCTTGGSQHALSVARFWPFAFLGFALLEVDERDLETAQFRVGTFAG